MNTTFTDRTAKYQHQQLQHHFKTMCR